MRPWYQALIIFVALLIVFTATGYFKQLSDEYGLTKAYSLVNGEISEIDPDDHSTCKYRYDVGGTAYSATGRRCGDATVGQKVQIYYAVATPARSTNLEPNLEFKNDLYSTLAALLFLPLFGALVATIRQRYW